MTEYSDKQTTLEAIEELKTAIKDSIEPCLEWACNHPRLALFYALVWLGSGIVLEWLL